MDVNNHYDLFCNQCLLQFGKKYVFYLHLSLVHGKKLVIKNEASEISSDESREDEIVKNSEKRKSFKCETCKKDFKLKSRLTRHVSSVHDEKKIIKM